MGGSGTGIGMVTGGGEGWTLSRATHTLATGLCVPLPAPQFHRGRRSVRPCGAERLTHGLVCMRPGDEYPVRYMEAGLCRRPDCIPRGSPTIREAHCKDLHTPGSRSLPEAMTRARRLSTGARVACACHFGLQLCVQLKCRRVSFSTPPLNLLCVPPP